jgi:geranylgeranyl pyrophosphate synthase
LTSPAPAEDRYDALLSAIALQVAALDGRPPGGALLGPRVLLLGAMDALPDERLVRLGVAVEFLRRATLVHRRPRSEHCSAENEGFRLSCTLHGDALLAESFRLLAADGDPRTVQILSAAMARVSEGELERLHDGGGAAARAAYAIGAADVAATLVGASASAGLALGRLAAVAGETHERRLDGEQAVLPDLPDNASQAADSGVAALLESVGSPDTLPDAVEPPVSGV